MPSKLGGLPSLSSPDVVAQPGAIPNYDEATAAFDKLAEQAKSIGDAELQQQSQQAGENAVTRDENGNIQAPPERPVLNNADAAYEQAAHARYLAETALDLNPKVAQLKAQYAGDPTGFRTAFDGLTAGAVGNAPSQYQGPIRSMLETQGTAALTDITADKQKSDIEDSKNSQIGLWSQNVARLSAMVRGGQIDSEDYKNTLAQTLSIEQSLKNNPAINLDRTDLARFDSLQPNLRGEAVVAHAISLYGQTQDEGQAEKYLSDNLNDPSIGVSDEEAHTLLGRGLAEIRTQHALTQQNSAELQHQVEYSVDDAYKMALATGDRSSILSDQQIYAAFPGNRARAQQYIEHLNYGAGVYQAQKATAMMPADQETAYLDGLNPALNPQKATAPLAQGGFDSAWNFTARHEGGYVPHDANGQPVNFGINQGANPDVDVKNLTPDQAKQLAKDRYWDTSGAANLPPGMDAIQFDTAYIFGPTAADEMLAQSGGDPQRYMQIREQKMAGMIAGDPAKFGKYQKAWDQRNSDLEAYAGTNGNNYAAAAGTYTAAVQALDAKHKAIQQDPAGYVLSQRPDIAQQIDPSNPQVFQQGIRALLANQQSLGVQSPRIFSNTVKANILQRINNPPDPSQRSQTILSTLNSLDGELGSYYPQALTELTRSGKMPADVTGLDWVRKGDPTIASRMSNAVNTGRTELSKLLPDGASTLDKDVVDGLSDFNGTLKGPGGSAVAAQMVQTTQLYARQLVAEGVDPTKAGAQAVQDIVGSNFHLADTYRVPTSIDPGAIGHGVNVIQNGLAPSNVEPFVGAKGVTFQDRQKASSDILKNSGVWLTLPDNSGLYLAWPAQTGYARARNVGGQPIQYTWAQLQAASKAPLSYKELNANADKAAAQVPRHVVGLAGQQ